MTIQLDYTKVFGYYSPADIKSVADSTLRKFLVFHNVMNLTATFISPLAGIIRTIVAAVMLHFYVKQYPNSKDKTIESIKHFMIAQMLRGTGEFFCFGAIFGVVDVIVSLNRYQMLCFAPSEAQFRTNLQTNMLRS